MRKIEEIMCDAVNNRTNRKIGNTEVVMYGDTCVVYLHGNAIWQQNEWQRKHNKAEFTLAGWNTDVTRNRLRALGVNLFRKNGKTYASKCKSGANAIEIDKNKWYSA